MDWTDYIKLAEELANSQDESAKRSAVSRAYYALYNHAKEWYYKDPNRRSIGLGDGTSSHRKLWEEIKHCGQSGRRISSVGTMLRTKRNSCDYDKHLKDPGILRSPELSIRQAKTTIDDIKKLG